MYNTAAINTDSNDENSYGEEGEEEMDEDEAQEQEEATEEDKEREPEAAPEVQAGLQAQADGVKWCVDIMNKDQKASEVLFEHKKKWIKLYKLGQPQPRIMA